MAVHGEDTEGESVLIGDEEQSPQLHRDLAKSGTDDKPRASRSPVHKSVSTKMQQHNKHKLAKKSPMSRVGLNASSKTAARDLHTDGDLIEEAVLNQPLSMTMSNRSEASQNGKSPFNYTQKSHTSQGRYNETQKAGITNNKAKKSVSRNGGIDKSGSTA